MESFNLDKWLQDKSRKVVTRDGRPVRIVCWDAKMKCPIMALVLNKSNNEEILLHYHVGGTYSALLESDVDLFFADEEEQDEFENTMVSFAHAMFDHLLDVTKEIDIKEWKDKLLGLARKELIENWRTCLRQYQKGYEQGKQAALKDLPKWKKANVFVSDEFGLATRDDDLIITWKGYQIKLSDLTTLPKEE